MTRRMLTIAALALALAACPRSSECLKNVETHMTLGTAYLNEARFEAALGEFFKAEEACSAAAKEPEIQHRIGMAFFGKEMANEAEERLLRAIGMTKDPFPQAYTNLSALYLSTERWEEAAEWAQKAIDVPTYTESGRAKNNLGYANLMMGKLDDAEKAYRSITSTTPLFCPAWHGLGRVEEARGNNSKASKHFERAAECMPDNPQYRFDAGRMLNLIGEVETARTHLDWVVKSTDEEDSLHERAMDLLSSLP